MEFLTAPTYTCIEIVCHGLVNLYRLLRTKDELYLFNFLYLMNSQACEEKFRAFRSMTSIFWTSVNLSMLDVLQKARRSNKMVKLEHKINEQSEYPTY